MKLRMLVALVTLSLLALLSPAWAQKTELPGLEGVWYSCADHEDNFDVIPAKHQVLFDKQGKSYSAKYQEEGNQIKFAGRTLIMKDGELDEGSTHWVNSSLLLETHCPGAAPQSQAALTANGTAMPELPPQPAASEQPLQTTEPTQTAQTQSAPSGNSVPQQSVIPIASQNEQHGDGAAAAPANEEAQAKQVQAATSKSSSLEFGEDPKLASLDLAELQQQANPGDANAQAELGTRYATGRGIARDYTQALAWFHKAADQGNARGEYLVGLCNEKGWGVGEDHKEAMAWFRKAADQQYPPAEYTLGIGMISKGAQGSNADMIPYVGFVLMFKEDKEMGHGRKLVQQAADQGYIPAQREVASWFRSRGHYEEAIAWYRKAADQGDHSAEIAIANMYRAGGKHFPKDPAEAARWYRKAADQGDRSAETTLGDIYLAGGEHFPKDPTEAATWYRKAADQNSADAQQKLGDLYRDGMGVAKDPAQASFWYGKAATSEMEIGNKFRDGIDFRKDSKEADRYYSRAAALRRKQADLGDPSAQVQLAKMYWDGAGVPKDKQQAANWYTKAAEQGNEEARQELPLVNKEIAQDQAAQAAQAQEQAKNQGSDRGKWIALAGWAGAALANAQGANAATVLKAGLATAAVAAKVTSNNGGQDQTTTALTSLAQAANGQTTNPIQQTANEQSAAIFRAGAQAAAQRGQTQQAAQALHMANVYDQAAAQQQQASTAEVASPSPSTSVQADPGAAPASNSAAGLPPGTKIDPSNGQPIAGTCERMDRFVKYSSTVNADDALLMSIQNTSSSDLFVWMKYKRSTWPAYTESLAGSPEWGPLHPGGSGEVDVCFLIGGKHGKGDCSRPDDIVLVAVKASDLHTVPPDGYERACDAEFNNVKWPQ